MTDDQTFNKNQKKRNPMYLGCFMRIGEEPVSYKRIYNKSYSRYMEILSALERYYNKNSFIDASDIKKLSVKALSESTGMTETMILRYTQEMAGFQEIYSRQSGGGWELKYNKPLLILQQKPKHLKKEYWSIKTPIYIFPNDEKFYDLE